MTVVPLLRLPLPWGDPLAAMAPFAGEEGTVLLDSASAGAVGTAAVASAGAAAGQGDPQAAYSFLYLRPRAVTWSGKGDGSDGPGGDTDPFARLERWHRRRCQERGFLAGHARPEEGVPVATGLVGWLAYEAGRHLEQLPDFPADDVGVPEAALGLYDVAAVFDHCQRRAWVEAWPVSIGKATALAARLAFALKAGGEAGKTRADAPCPDPLSPDFPFPGSGLTGPAASVSLVPGRSPEQALQAARQVIEHIYAGDIFQANLTHRFQGHLAPGRSLPGQALALYRRLRRRSPAPFAAFARFGGASLLSASPERFLAVSPQGLVETRPIKGTARRSPDPRADAALATALAGSEKDRAENLMIVDLMRNDLSRVCRVGSVHVPQLCAVETFASVHHLVSVVRGDLVRPDDIPGLLRACFPGGSITGAPKIKAMEILRQLEPWRRGLYCGTLFRWGDDGSLDSSILIRSLVVGRQGAVVAHAGGGVVADSSPVAEWEETLLKLAPLLAACTGDGPEA